MSAADDFARMLAEGRANDPYLQTGYPTSAEANFDAMNPYMQQISQDNPYVEEPNDWAKILMSLADQNNQWSAAQAQKQMNFQERMSNTAHVREIADLKAAGLNPVLSAKLGGASTPVGAQGTTDTSITGSIVQLMNKMLDVESDNAQMQLTRELANMSGSGSGNGSEYGLMAALIDMIPGMSAKQSEVFANFLAGILGKGNGNSGKSKIIADVQKGNGKITITNPKTGETRKPNELDDLITVVQRAMTGSNRLMTK